MREILVCRHRGGGRPWNSSSPGGSIKGSVLICRDRQAEVWWDIDKMQTRMPGWGHDPVESLAMRGMWVRLEDADPAWGIPAALLWEELAVGEGL